MKYFLVVDELKYKPGLYGTKHTIDEIKAKLEKKKEEEDELGFWGWLFVLTIGFPFFLFFFFKGMFSQDDKIRLLLPDLPNNKLLPASTKEKLTIKENPNTPIFRNCIILSDVFLNEYNDYNNRIFQNAFKSSKHLMVILPENSGNDLIIISQALAKQYFNNEEIELGLNKSNKGYTELIPLQNYSINKWHQLTTNLFTCFRNLGAKGIILNEDTRYSNTNKIEIEHLKEISIKFRTEYERDYNFSFTRIIENSIYKPEKAQQYLDTFKEECPLIYANAIDAIENEPTGSMEFEETVDMKFKLSVEVLGAFQGSFKGGYYKKFNVKITF
ncbi:MAG: hypothetical protein ABSG15_13525 [FCB group bacterium]|jgi:hypothetical protein